MKRLGTVLHIIDNMLIVRADKTIDKGAAYQNLIIISKRMNRIGKIKELFGPVSNPFFSIKILEDVPGSEIKQLKNERVYLQ